MSCLCCSRCARVIDTDEDPGAYIEATDEWLCEPCRERDEATKTEA
jgi:hypothetical protein